MMMETDNRHACLYNGDRLAGSQVDGLPNDGEINSDARADNDDATTTAGIRAATLSFSAEEKIRKARATTEGPKSKLK